VCAEREREILLTIQKEVTEGREHNSECFFLRIESKGEEEDEAKEDKEGGR
jgi:hypothetical protein